MEEELNLFFGFLENDKKVSNNTLQSYERDLKQYERYLSEQGKEYKEETNEGIKEYITYMQEIGKKSSTISRGLASIRSFYQYGVKNKDVENDPTEQGERAVLNLGHTIGHAYESLSFKKNRPLLHGHAVAAGIVSELYLSHKVCGFPMEKLSQVVYYLKEYYPAFVFDCKDYDALYELMTHDKKNEAGVINFTLLSQVGDVQINRQVSKEKILESLDFYRESFGV